MIGFDLIYLIYEAVAGKETGLKNTKSNLSLKVDLWQRAKVSAIVYIGFSTFFLFAGFRKPFFSAVFPVIFYLLLSYTIQEFGKWNFSRQRK